MDDHSYDGWDLEALAQMPNYYGWIMSWFAPHIRGRVLEYGSGTGTISAYLRPHADSLTLVEPSAQLHTALRARFPDDKNVEISAQMLEEHVGELATNAMDTAILVNVLEHIEDDRAALAELSRVVAPGGHVLIFVPAMPGLMSKLDRLVGHFRRYRRAELRAKLEAAGLDVLTCRYFDFPGVPPWYLLNVLIGSTSFNPMLLQIYDRFVVPVARRLEGLAAPPFGKNLIAVARQR